MKARELRSSISLPSHRHVTIGDLFLACAGDEKFFQELLRNPAKALVERQLELPRACLEKLQEYLKNPEMLRWLEDIMKYIHKPVRPVETALRPPCVWGECP